MENKTSNLNNEFECALRESSLHLAKDSAHKRLPLIAVAVGKCCKEGNTKNRVVQIENDFQELL